MAKDHLERKDACDSRLWSAYIAQRSATQKQPASDDNVPSRLRSYRSSSQVGLGTKNSRGVLILCAERELGNVPIETLVLRDTSYLIKYAIAWASETEDIRLPLFDLVFNAAGDPDIGQPLRQRLVSFA
jgi:hypothetical protein